MKSNDTTNAVAFSFSRNEIHVESLLKRRRNTFSDKRVLFCVLDVLKTSCYKCECVGLEVVIGDLECDIHAVFVLVVVHELDDPLDKTKNQVFVYFSLQLPSWAYSSMLFRHQGQSGPACMERDSVIARTDRAFRVCVLQ